MVSTSGGMGQGRGPSGCTAVGEGGTATVLQGNKPDRPQGEGTPGLWDRRGNLAENNLGKLDGSVSSVWSRSRCHC